MAASESSFSSETESSSKGGSGKSQVSEKVRKCIRALEAAETDTEKFATLFLVPKLVKGTECNKEARLSLMKGIGYSFLARMLRSKDSPDGCPKLMFQSVALSVLSCFAQDEEIMTHPSVLFNLPMILDIITNAEDEQYEENLLIIKDAYQCLSAVVSVGGDKGRAAFINNRGIHSLCEVISKQIFQYEDATDLMIALLSVRGHLCWSYHSAFEDFNSLMGKLCTDFANSQDETKFELCDTIRTVLRSYPKSNFDGDDIVWMPMLQQGLHDILFSRLGKKQRDPAMMLVASVIEVSDFQWCLNNYEPSDDEESDEGRFFFVILNMACIEVIMHLEEQNLDIVMANSELLVACYFIVESAVSYLSNPENHLSSVLKQKLRIQQSLNNAFAAILKFLQDLSTNVLKEEPQKMEDPQVKYFVCATIRILGAWLSEETQALREDVYDIVPFIFELANETFEAQKISKLSVLPGRGSACNFTPETALNNLQKEGSQTTTPDTLRFLVPGMCHLVAEDKPRKIILEMKMHETLFTYLSYHWTIFDSHKHWLKEQSEGAGGVSEPKFMLESSNFEMVNSKYAMVTICNVLMNITVLEPGFVEETSIFFHLLKFLMNSLPTLQNTDDQLVLYGNFSVLGLLVVKHHSRRPKSTDFSVYKFIQAVIRFLWDAHNTDDPEEGEFSVSNSYLPYWNDLIDLWYLGMQVLCSLLKQLPWIAEFIMESGWAQEIIADLSKVRRGGLEIGVKAAFDDLLSSLVASGGQDVIEEFQKCGAIQVCQTHTLKELARAVANEAVKNRQK